MTGVRRTPGPGARPVLTFLMMAGFLMAAAWVIWSRHSEFVAALTELNWLAVAGSAACAVVGTLALFRSWLAALADGGVRLSSKDGLWLFSVAQLGKYVPGAIWTVVAQAQLGRRIHVPATRMMSGALLSLAISVCVALVIGCLALPFSGETALQSFWWAPLAAVPFLIALTPAVLNRLLDLVARILRRSAEPAAYSWSGLLISAGWCVVANLAFGAHIMFLAAPLGVSGVQGYLVSLCAFSLASAIGVLIVFAPAGAGVRELVLTVVLSAVLSISGALVVALASRALLVAVDVGLALSQLPGPRREKDPGPQSSA